MKKLLIPVICLVMICLSMMTSFAGAEASGLFAQIRGKTFDFASGVGAWDTELTVGENGAFTGNFHDSEMGETGEGYPYGTVYVCSFHGTFSAPEPIDEYSWKVQVSVEIDERQTTEWIEDEIRYVTTTPYGLEKAQSVIFYRPGTPVDHLPENYMIWSHLQEIDPEAKEIPYYAIWNEEDEAGFISFTDTAEEEPADWNLPETIEMTSAAADAFHHAMESLVGVNYEPLGFLGEKEGTYCILCRATVVYPGAKPTYALVYVNETGVQNIWEIWMDKHANP